METNNLRRDLLDITKLSPWATEVGGNRKQMFSDQKLDMLRRKIIARAEKIVFQNIRRHNYTNGEVHGIMKFIHYKTKESNFEQLRMLEMHVKMWERSSVADVVAYWENVIWNSDSQRVLLSNREGTGYFSRDGWKVVREGGPEDRENWVLYNPYGTIVHEHPFLDMLKDMYSSLKFVEYEDRYGRHGKSEMDIKYGPAHFPKGTVVEVNPEYKDHLGSNVFTVNHVIVIGARNFLLVMDEIKPGVPGSRHFPDAPRQYNMYHVWKIVKRGDGPLDVREDFPDYRPMSVAELICEQETLITEFFKEKECDPIRLRKGEHVFGSETRLINCILHEVGRKPEHYGKWLNESNLHVHMKAKGFGRFVSIYSPINADWMYFYVFNVKKLAAWIKNNQHQLFMRLDETQAIEEERDRKQCEELMEADW